MTLGSSGHPGLEQLDELLDSGTDAPREVRAHVEECPKCSGELDDLTRVRSLLASAREDVPMPALLTDRINAALLTEAGYRVAGGVPAHERLSFDDGPPVFDVPLPRGESSGTPDLRSSEHNGGGHGSNVVPLRRRRSPLVWLGTAAAAALAIGVGGGLVSQQFNQMSASTSVDGAAPEDMSSDTAPGGSAMSAPSASELPSLNPQSLPEAVRQHSSPAESTAMARQAADPTCAAKLGLDPSTPTFAAMWEGSDGQPPAQAVVYLVQVGQGSQVTVVDAACQAGDEGGFRYDTRVEP